MNINEISKKLDKIIVSKKEVSQITKWLNDSDETMGSLGKNVFFPLNEFVMDIEIFRNIHYVFLIELENFDPHKGRFSNEDWDIRYSFDDQLAKQLQQKFFEGMKHDANFNTTRMHAILYGTMLYICKKARDRITRVSPQVTRQERENYEYKPRECFLLNDIVKYVSIHPNKSSVKYRCEVWGVRGHLRHYKDGKVVFIKPYKKGSKRDILEPKSRTYLLKGGDEE